MEKEFSKIDLEVDKDSHDLFFGLLFDELNSPGIDQPKRFFSITHKSMPRSDFKNGVPNVIYVDSYAVYYTSYCLYDAGGETSKGTRYFYDDSKIWKELDTMYRNIRIDRRDKIIDEVLS